MSVALSAQGVSRALKEGGLDRAGRYTPWGYTADGFIVTSGPQHGNKIVVLFTRHNDAGRQDYERALVILDEVGFVAEPNGRPGVGGSYSIKVTGKKVQS